MIRSVEFEKSRKYTLDDAKQTLVNILVKSLQAIYTFDQWTMMFCFLSVFVCVATTFHAGNLTASIVLGVTSLFSIFASLFGIGFWFDDSSREMSAKILRTIALVDFCAVLAFLIVH